MAICPFFSWRNHLKCRLRESAEKPPAEINKRPLGNNGSFGCIACDVWRLFFAAFRRLIPLHWFCHVLFQQLTVCPAVSGVKLIGLKSDCDGCCCFFPERCIIPRALQTSQSLASDKWRWMEKEARNRARVHLNWKITPDSYINEIHTTQLTQLVRGRLKKPHDAFFKLIFRGRPFPSSVWNL